MRPKKRLRSNRRSKYPVERSRLGKQQALEVLGWIRVAAINWDLVREFVQSLPDQFHWLL
jgi:membrane protein required for beta-lactamase induction